MDGYLFFGQKLVSRLLKPEECHEELFKGANRVFTKVQLLVNKGGQPCSFSAFSVKIYALLTEQLLLARSQGPM